jgi:hypothetical protein
MIVVVVVYVIISNVNFRTLNTTFFFIKIELNEKTSTNPNRLY